MVALLCAWKLLVLLLGLYRIGLMIKTIIWPNTNSCFELQSSVIVIININVIILDIHLHSASSIISMSLKYIFAYKVIKPSKN